MGETEARKSGAGQCMQDCPADADGKGITNACGGSVGPGPGIRIGHKFAGVRRSKACCNQGAMGWPSEACCNQGAMGCGGWRSAAWHLFRSLSRRRYHHRPGSPEPRIGRDG